MALSRIATTLTDFGLGIRGSNPPRGVCSFGVSPTGVDNTRYLFSQPARVLADLGPCPLAEELIFRLTSQEQVEAVVVPWSTHGDVGSVTFTGTGTGTLTATAAPHETIVITIVTPGALATMQFQYSVGGGPLSEVITSETGTPWDYQIPGTFTTAHFAVGTYVDNSTYARSRQGVTTLGGGAINTVTFTHSPTDYAEFRCRVATPGAPGTARIAVSLDGGITELPAISTGASAHVLDTGVVLAFGGTTYDQDDVFTFLAAPPIASTNAIVDAIEARLAISDEWFLGLVDDYAYSTASAITQAQSIAQALDVAFTDNEYLRFLTQTPDEGDIIVSGGAAIYDTADTDSVKVTGYDPIVEPRIIACSRRARLISPTDGSQKWRPTSWVVARRLGDVAESVDGAQFSLGALTNVTNISKDERVFGTLDGARINTLTTYRSQPGFYISATDRGPGVKTLALDTSDYARAANARVIDAVSKVTYQACLIYIQSRLDTNSAGNLTRGQARRIEAHVGAQLENALVNGTDGPQFTSYQVVADTSNNVLASQELNLSVNIVPYGYAGRINITLGFNLPQ